MHLHDTITRKHKPVYQRMEQGSLKVQFAAGAQLLQCLKRKFGNDHVRDGLQRGLPICPALDVSHLAKTLAGFYGV
jgi:hypothetical protein